MSLSATAAREELERFRQIIDRIDLNLLSLLNERTKVVEEIGRVKQQAQFAVYEPKREDQVLANVMGHNAGPLPAAAVQRIFERIIDEMRTIQQQKIEGEKR